MAGEKEARVRGAWRRRVLEGREAGTLQGASSHPGSERGDRKGAQVLLGPTCRERVVCLERHDAFGFAHFQLTDKD